MFSKVETIGDAYMGVGGCPNENQEHPVNALEMALHMVMATGMITTPNGDNLQIRAGPVLWPSLFLLNISEVFDQRGSWVFWGS